ncbi:hypothetical protein LINPERPRIM_LOCUS2141, partial [Linum perenne]
GNSKLITFWSKSHRWFTYDDEAKASSELVEEFRNLMEGRQSLAEGLSTLAGDQIRSDTSYECVQFV